MNRFDDRIRKVDFPPIRVGRRLMVVPSWVDLPAVPELITIRLNPGSAFGTGEHPTTRLCLAALERHLTPGQTVVDLGTGTGVLAIAAAKLGAGTVLALDTDPEAVRVAKENVATNGVVDKVRVAQGSLDEVLSGRLGVAQTQLLVSNILANVILRFFEQGLTQVVPSGGLLVLSGILRRQTPEIRACLQWHGLEQLAQEKLDDWVCVIARRSCKIRAVAVCSDDLD